MTVVPRGDVRILAGKFDTAFAVDGAGGLFIPVVFAVGGLNGWALTSLDLEGSAAVKMLLPAMAVRGRARSLH